MSIVRSLLQRTKFEVENHYRLRLLALMIGCAGAVLFALRVAGQANQFVLIWPVSGVGLALLLAYWPASRRELYWSILAASVGVLLGGFAAGMPSPLPVYDAIYTAIDMGIGSLLMGNRIRSFDDLKRTDNAIRFGLTTLVAPVVTGVLGAFPVSAALHESLLLTASMNVLADSVGIGLVLPLLLLVLTGRFVRLKELIRQRPMSVWWFGAFLAITAYVFWQTTRPFLFIIFPPLIAVVVLFGLEGGIIASLVAIQVGWFATSHHHGPLWLNKAALADERLMTLQVFVWVSLATALSIGAVVDERRRVQGELDEASAIYHILVDHAPDMIVLSSLNGSRRYVSPAVKKLTGWTPEEYLALDRLKTLHPEDQHIGASMLDGLREDETDRTIRYRMMHKDGSSRWVEASIKSYGSSSSHGIAGYVATVRDITAIKEAEETLTDENVNLTKENERVAILARKDALTGLVNRRGFDEAMTRVQHRRKGDQVALLMIDVDFFKKYNDTLGHQRGDECLQRVAQVLTKRIQREGDLVARYGGEEFVVLLPDADRVGALGVANELLENIRAQQILHPSSPFQIVTFSIGVSVSGPEPVTDAAALIAKADEALYESKRSGRNRATVWEPSSLADQTHLASEESNRSELTSSAG